MLKNTVVTIRKTLFCPPWCSAVSGSDFVIVCSEVPGADLDLAVLALFSEGVAEPERESSNHFAPAFCFPVPVGVRL